MNATASPLVSIVVPCHDEADSVDVFYRELCSAIAAVECRFELVFVDDGSEDGTIDKLLAIARTDRRVSVIELSRNFGKEAALSAGLEIAAGDAVIPIDADLQDPPSLIPQLIGEWRQGADVVLAARADRSSDSLPKRLSASVFYAVHNRMSAVQIPPNVGDFRLMSRPVVDALRQLPETHRFMKGLYAWVGFRSKTVPYLRRARQGGASKFSGWRLWNFALEGITSFSSVPLRIWSYLGVVGAIITAAYGGWLVLRTLIHGIDVPGYASLMTAVLFIGSLQLLALGAIGEYLGRVYDETKKRPRFIIRKIHAPAPDASERSS